MGTPLFAVPSLEALLRAGYNVKAAVTQPDKPAGRGKLTQPSPVKTVASKNNIRVLEPVKIRDEGFINDIRGLCPEFIAVVAYGKILPQALLDIPKRGCVNVHASLLPKYRGAAPINWAIINGDKTTGVSTMLMDKGMDTGPTLLEERVDIGAEETAGDLSIKLSIVGARLLVKTLELLSGGMITPRPQGEAEASYAPMLRKDDGLMDWGKGAEELGNLVRGLFPWPGAHTRWDGRLIKVHRAKALTNDDGAEALPGTVIDASGDAIRVKCLRGSLDILELQPESKRRMNASDFIKGYRIKRGDVFA